MPRYYADLLTLNPVQGAPGDGFNKVQMTACAGDPNGQDGLDELAAGSIAFEIGTGRIWVSQGNGVWLVDVGGARTAFTFRPGGTADEISGVYTTWATVHAAAAAAADANEIVTIIVDDSLVSPAVISAGTFDMARIQLLGARALGVQPLGGGSRTLMQTTIGSVFTNWTLGAPHIQLTHVGTAALYTPSGAGVNSWRTGENSRYVSTVTSLWRVLGGAGPAVVFADDYTDFDQTDTGVSLFSVTAPNTLAINFGAGVNMGADKLAGDGDVDIDVTSFAYSVDNDQSTLTGTLTIVLPDILYVPGDAGDWVNPDPTTLTEAIDRLANAVAGLLGAPIP